MNNVFEYAKELVRADKLHILDGHSTKISRWIKEGEKENVIGLLNRSSPFYQRHGFETETDALFRSVPCKLCGNEIDYYLNDDVLIPNTLSCIKETTLSVTIPVPSGRLLLNDCFRHEHIYEVYNQIDRGDITSIKGRLDRTIAYAKVGMGHFYVGNTSPHVFEKDGEFTIGYLTYLETDEQEIELPPVEGAIDHESICTDLWWVSLCDASIFRDLFVEKHGEKEADEVLASVMAGVDLVLEVEPGDYTLTYNGLTRRDIPIIATLTKKL